MHRYIRVRICAQLFPHKIYIFLNCGQCLFSSFFNTQTMHIKSFYSQQHCFVSLKTSYPEGIRTRVFLFQRRMRCPLRHAARAHGIILYFVRKKIYNNNIITIARAQHCLFKIHTRVGRYRTHDSKCLRMDF
jgi:hypothetical protein